MSLERKRNAPRREKNKKTYQQADQVYQFRQKRLGEQEETFQNYSVIQFWMQSPRLGSGVQLESGE